MFEDKGFPELGVFDEGQTLLPWSQGSLYTGMVVPGSPASLSTRPASCREAVSTSRLYKEHIFPKRRGLPGHGRRTEDLAIAIATESLEVIRPLPR